MLAERKLYTDTCRPICAKSHEAAEGADFPKQPSPVDVAGLKLAYNLVLLTGIPLGCMTCACHGPFGNDARTKNWDFLCA